MPEADEVERLIPTQLLVPGLQVDRRVPGWTALRIEVAPVDVHPDSTELVDQLAEAPEVDRDQVVDRNARELAHGLERASSTAVGVGSVDLGRVRRFAGADDLCLEIAWEREHRDRVVLRIRADKHEGVRARGRSLGLARATVVPDDESCRGLTGDREIEPLRSDPHIDASRCHGGHRLMEIEVRPTSNTDRADGDDSCGPPENRQCERTPARWRRLRLTVDGDRPDRTGRQLHLAVAVAGMATTNASFECRPHTETGASRPFDEDSGGFG